VEIILWPGRQTIKRMIDITINVIDEINRTLKRDMGAAGNG
jgi:hypothetical protein